MKYYSIFILSIILFTSCSENKKEEKPEANKSAVIKYQLAIVEKGAVATEIKLPAQFAAYQEVNIFPKVNGYVKTILADIGTKVSKGDLLMILQAPELEQASVQAKEHFAKVQSDYAIDKEHYQRLLEASKTSGAVSPLDLSTIKAKMESDLSLCNAEKANWEMQQTMLGYLRVTAPFSGVITERNVSAGALVSASIKDKPMLELKQVDLLRLQVDVPENIVTSLKEKDSVSFYVSASLGKKMRGIISRKSNNVNAQYRYERIEIDVLNKDGSLAPGMFADVILNSKGDQNAMVVPKSAVVNSTEGKYVLLFNEEKIKRIDIITGNTTAEKIEIYGALKPGDQVIENANDEMLKTNK